MFNRNNFPFGGRPDAGRAPPQNPYGQAPGDARYEPVPRGYGASPRPNGYDTVMTDVHGDSRGYGAPQPPAARQLPARPPVGRPQSGAVWTLRPAKSPDNTYTFGNL